jgi:uncharacterized protein (DUF1778 family)
MAKTKLINIRTTEDDYESIRKFAAFQGATVSSIMLDSVIERIEDWEDIQAIREYEKEKAAGTLELTPWADVQRELEL